MKHLTHTNLLHPHKNGQKEKTSINEASEPTCRSKCTHSAVNKWKALTETTVSLNSNKPKALSDLGLLEQACRKTATTTS